MTNELNIDHEQEDNAISWYVLALAKDRENILARSLQGIANAQSVKEIHEIYLPTTPVSSWKNNQKVVKLIPSKPGYLFVKAVNGYLDTKEMRLKIQTSYRVIGTVSEAEINNMKNESLMAREVDDIEIQEGSQVIINTGIFAGLKGRVKEIADNGTYIIRIWLMDGCQPTDVKDIHRSDITSIDNNKEEM